MLLPPCTPLALLLKAVLLPIGGLVYTIYQIYQWQRVGSPQRPSVVAPLVPPGMLPDAFVVLFAGSILPSLVPDQTGPCPCG